MYRFVYCNYPSDVVNYLNEHNIIKDDIISVYGNNAYMVLIYYEKEEEENEENDTNSNVIPNYGGCYNCDKRNDGCCYTGKPKLCRNCETKPGCKRYE